MPQIAANFAQVRQRIEDARKRFNRSDSVELLAVSKTKPVSLIEQAWQCGQRHFGENYLQEALEKIEQLKDKGIHWHFIGSIQSNKTGLLAQHFDWVHCVDRAKIAHRLNDARGGERSPLNICLQVNISGETSKAGVSLDELPQLANEVARYPNLALRGLMTIPASSDDFSTQQRPFAQVADALKTLQQQLPEQPLDTLSMGMSNDLEAAIAQGATFVRVGTALFGTRAPIERTP
ncbi:YggS family pyridoxal phosphate-dependent enzyme [Aestuariirhabdus sp. Z084]|uniref:YggS family pyridoxal phosphate-dependent enzyme n=1 Tax=Aestuariirhabdus haliotis TaxID=2918751 RepID=UPI00201B40BD|nr:YggS family pyridoxal phosphate-dependent enzyme [Aestuariirhabdus haliotis]MCL6414145.1 YggS family pyridoxal phosphate-dependent enzyme [Aestuariirhabdus haliotis]MCL6418077.1 YggS family pyridoxal phosphate-dependent enzyme [Aestuariirhabdus haliotis]